MLQAPSIAEVQKTMRHKPAALMVLLFAPPFSRLGKKTVIPRLPYLHERAGEYVHFFCVGYSGYGPMPGESDEPVCIIDGTRWFFNAKDFGGFVTQFEEITRWKYSGESELIIPVPGFHLDSKSIGGAELEAVIFDIEKMLKDSAINTAAQLFEAIIRFAHKSHLPDVAAFSDKEGIRILGDALAEGILALLPKPARTLWKRGLHYRVQNIAR